MLNLVAWPPKVPTGGVDAALPKYPAHDSTPIRQRLDLMDGDGCSCVLLSGSLSSWEMVTLAWLQLAKLLQERKFPFLFGNGCPNLARRIVCCES
jgi:hypothetical protein